MVSVSQKRGAKPLPLYRRFPREYAIWRAMRQRCGNSRCKGYEYYGARGIGVCARWSGKNGFRNFIADLGPQPFPGASVNRKNNDGNYTPSNVAWAGRKAQARNMRSNRLIEFGGRTMTLAEWAEQLGIKPGTLGARLAYGRPIEEALTKPVEKRAKFTPWPSHRPWQVS